MNDLPKTESNISKPVLFPDDTSIIVTKRSHTQFANDSNRLFENINDWFGINLLSLNFHKIYYLQFMTKYIHKINMNIFGKNKQLIHIYSTIFLGLFIGSCLSWNNHIAPLVSRLSPACYAISSVKLFVTQDTLRKFYFSYVLSIWNYVIIFLGNSQPCNNILKIQKK